MKKELHLICNAHLDPVWQWEWEEGAAETLSTFRVAAKFCHEFDGAQRSVRPSGSISATIKFFGA